MQAEKLELKSFNLSPFTLDRAGFWSDMHCVVMTFQYSLYSLYHTFSHGAEEDDITTGFAAGVGTDAVTGGGDGVGMVSGRGLDGRWGNCRDCF